MQSCCKVAILLGLDVIPGMFPRSADNWLLRGGAGDVPYVFRIQDVCKWFVSSFIMDLSQGSMTHLEEVAVHPLHTCMS